VAAPYVTAALILAAAGKGSPTAAETAWAETCAAAIEARIAHRMADVTVTAGIEDELIRAATLDGVAAFVDKDAPHGIQTTGPDGQTARLGRDIVRALEPVFTAYALPGIG
jgi:hypothetical protein